MENSLVVRFTPKKEQYVRATRILARKSPGFMVLVAILALAVIASAVILIFPGVGQQSWNSIALMVILVGAFYLFYFTVLVPMQFSKNYQKNKYLQMEREFIISDEKMIMNVGDKSSNLQWENFQKVLEDDDFYLLLYKAQERFYPFITKSAFEDQESLDAFLSLLAEKSIPVK
jgi:hypothetical protein